eukprot:2599547-Amphidinium_carterae.1
MSVRSKIRKVIMGNAPVLPKYRALMTQMPICVVCLFLVRDNSPLKAAVADFSYITLSQDGACP